MVYILYTFSFVFFLPFSCVNSFRFSGVCFLCSSFLHCFLFLSFFAALIFPIFFDFLSVRLVSVFILSFLSFPFVSVHFFTLVYCGSPASVHDHLPACPCRVSASRSTPLFMQLFWLKAASTVLRVCCHHDLSLVSVVASASQ